LQKYVKFEWNDSCQQAFEKLKIALTTAPVLTLPDFKRRFILTTDSSTTAIVYILSQKDDQGREQVISYGGRALRPSEAKWGITQLECLAVIEGVREYHVYLASNEFLVLTDHFSLTYINRMRLSGSGANNRLCRWALFLQAYKFEIMYKKGELMTSADALSRIQREPQELLNMADDDDDDELIANVSAMCRDSSKKRVNITFEIDNEEDVQVVASVGSTLTTSLPTLEEIKATVKLCPDFAAIYSYLESGTLPLDDALARRTVIESADYVLQKGLLYHSVFAKNSSNKQSYGRHQTNVYTLSIQR
jgi:hypothetical protein